MSNIDPTIQEAIEVVDDINESFGEKAWENGIGVTLHYFSHTYGIFFGDFHLWDADNDDRDEDENGNKVELKQHVKEALCEFKSILENVGG